MNQKAKTKTIKLTQKRRKGKQPKAKLKYKTLEPQILIRSRAVLFSWIPVPII